MKPLATRVKQRGAVLWMLLLIVLTASALMLFRPPSPGTPRDIALLKEMSHAKEALIARSVADDNRPGSLPCPDLITDSHGLNNHPGDGLADLFTLTQCPSYIGWLPWATLDLPETLDDSGSRLWYVLAPGFRDDDSAQPINSDTPGTVQFDGRNDLVALIIAPRSALIGQQRPSRRISDYLEQDNPGSLVFHNAPASTSFNDLFLPISRGALMAAVEKRVAGEVQRCLAAHAIAPGNSGLRYPWPAPLTSNERQGQSETRFGRIPLTQPGAGMQAQLDDQISALTARIDQLTIAHTASEQRLALSLLSEQWVALRNLADLIFQAANEMTRRSNELLSLLVAIDNAVYTASANNRISRNEGELIRTRADAATPVITSLRTLLEQTGSDPYPTQLRQLATSLIQAGPPHQRQSLIQRSADLLQVASSPHPDLQIPLRNAKNAAQTALTANLLTTTPTEQAYAQATSQSLSKALQTLAESIEASHVNQRASDINLHVSTLRELSSQSLPADAFTQPLATVRLVVESLKTSQPEMRQLRSQTLQALVAAQAAPLTATTPAILALQALADALARHEQTDNNLTRSSLDAAITRYQAEQASFRQIDQASPRPVQTAITPYANALGNTTVDLVLLVKMLGDQAASQAPLAKAYAVAAPSDPAKTNVLDSSLYRQAELGLASLTGKNSAPTLLASATSASTQSKIDAALAGSLQQAEATLVAARSLLPQVTSGHASAQAMLWLSARCDFLRPNSNSWWLANQWDKATFYQISPPSAAYPGQLTVDDKKSLKTVTLVAGQALTGQNHWGAIDIRQYLEADNGDPSRNAPANTPSRHFISRPISPSFNDRLAF